MRQTLAQINDELTNIRRILGYVKTSDSDTVFMGNALVASDRLIQYINELINNEEVVAKSTESKTNKKGE